MVEHWIKERIAVFHLLRSWNESCWDDKTLCVAQTRGHVVENIDKDPAVRVLVAIQLSTIDGQLYKNIVLLNLPRLDSFQVIPTTGGIVVLPERPTMRPGILEN